MNTQKIVKEIDLDMHAIMCNDSNCNSLSHKQVLNNLYNKIIDGLIDASSHIKCKSNIRQYVIPGWNKTCKEANDVALTWYHIWLANNKPRNGFIFDTYIKYKYKFKYAVRACRRNEVIERSNILATELSKHDYCNFWKNVNKSNINKLPLASTVSGVTGECEIANFWKSYYEQVLNQSRLNNERNTNCISGTHSDTCTSFTVQEVLNCIKTLKTGKSFGMDGISSEHLKYAHGSVLVLLSLCINGMIKHCFLPERLMSTAIVPILKDKTGDVTDSHNYRPISITTACSKLLESLILKKYEKLLYTCDNQFGFKKGHSTELCIFSFKQILSYYKNHNSPVFVSFLDASKAFDRVNHKKLFSKLLDRGIPGDIVKLLMYWYSEQLFVVRWGNTFSDCFKVSNGVRQGGVLSPYLYNVYIDELLLVLNNSGIGCSFNGSSMNNFAYADDLVVLAPSPSGLQKLLNICEVCASSLDIIFNVKKCVYMCIKPKKYKLRIPSIYLCGKSLQLVNSFKYLGHYITEDLCDNNDIKRQLNAIYCKGNMLIRKFYNCSTDVKCLLFKSYCTNFYSDSLWWSYSDVGYNRVKTAYNNSFRYLLNLNKSCSASGMFFNNNIDSFQVLRRKSLNRFRKRLLICKNCIVESLCNCYNFYCSSFMIECRKILY